jgi:hypothetical protein
MIPKTPASLGFVTSVRPAWFEGAYRAETSAENEPFNALVEGGS